VSEPVLIVGTFCIGRLAVGWSTCPMADFDDHETAPLAPGDNILRPGLTSNRSARPRGAVGVSQASSTKSTGASGAGAPDWERYGLKGDSTSNGEGHDIDKETATFDRRPDAAGIGGIGTIGENNEIFNEHQVFYDY